MTLTYVASTKNNYKSVIKLPLSYEEHVLVIELAY